MSHDLTPPCLQVWISYACFLSALACPAPTMCYLATPLARELAVHYRRNPKQMKIGAQAREFPTTAPHLGYARTSTHAPSVHGSVAMSPTCAVTFARYLISAVLSRDTDGRHARVAGVAWDIRYKGSKPLSCAFVRAPWHTQRSRCSAACCSSCPR